MDEPLLRKLLDKGLLEPFIRHIRFPQYKNIAPFTKIDFTFPITALVGANGTNKSSLLRALYGAPEKNNLGNFWFSTDTDVIVEGDSFPNCFIYGYKHPASGQTIEVLKTRIEKEKDPDYWEPSRPIRRYLMSPMPTPYRKDPQRTLTRWRPIEKHVELVDFRHSLSAFDRYFYYGDFTRSATFKNKKDFIRSRAFHLGASIESGATTHVFYKKERIVDAENRTLSSEALEEICAILERQYTEIKLIQHTYFQQPGHTAKLQHADLSYTEAFAGSGEFAAIKLVTAIMDAPRGSLILLDEPEVSLHPGAQERLLDFIASEVIKKKHQVVFTTHSPALIRMLPPDAIKVLALDGLLSKVVLLAQSALPNEAFLKIGEVVGKKTILVEDRLAAEVVRKALRDHSPTLLGLVDIRFFAGGASVLFEHYLTAYAAEERKDVLCLLDGDNRPGLAWPSDQEVGLLGAEAVGATIKTLTGVSISFKLNSGTETRKTSDAEEAGRQFLRWCGKWLGFLPGEGNPEHFILNKTGKADGSDAKVRFEKITRQQLGVLSDEDVSGDDIFLTQRMHLAKIDVHDIDLKFLAEKIDLFLRASTEH